MSYAQYFAIESKFKTLGLQKHRSEWVAEFTDSRKESLKDLTPAEYREFIRFLNQTLKTADKKQSDAELQQRRKVIALLCQVGYTAGEKADMLRIKEWCLKYGNGKANLNGHKGEKLTKLVTQAQEMYNKHLQGL